MPRTTKRDRYHHGDLRAALIDTAMELIAEHGVQGFSLAEASRRLGVAVSAPYRHFADRDELLLAVGVRASELLVTAVRAEESGTAAEDRLVAVARGYVRFAAKHRALFESLFGTALSPIGEPELERAARPVKEAFHTAAMTLADGDPTAAEALGVAVAATAHGYAGLLRLGMFGKGEAAVDTAVGRAAAATRALIEGRAALY
ncbi:TetR/AcrR family transcriptional regulator [Nonomuraea turkmeniaca]|uniref:TetR/AcrR family transcriptional regulator n=1 Tax=Nonomuraea turkmeniaca TaxID=103838 RepID=A0A5S4FE12_9ACTN|nr:TetR/AcrR family transcriptional regulator [Nonomuraea turkmeniaca]TMR16650.1 TetR/AcrR family transcriptional regulator [Nonomuraea turkmeniaca]